jgi:dienelactone hydrolase
MSTAFIIYPGGRIDPRSYAQTAHAIAARGYLAIIVPMPLNLAVLGANSASSVIESYPDIQHWAIGGHSLGGTMAAQFAYKNPSKIEGLVLWAAYPASGNDLSGLNIDATTIHGSDDGLVSQSEIDSSLSLLPADTIRVEIERGNHAQFGWYGRQPGDNEATISRELQQDQIVVATVMLLEKLGSKTPVAH